MKHKIAQIILIIFVVIIACILLFACGSKSTEPSHAESYELYVLDSFTDGKPRLVLYNTYKVKPENINTTGNIITTYNATDGTQITFANNGVTVISPKGYTESFTQGYMKITRKVLVKAI
jgi:hypothetical protein